MSITEMVDWTGSVKPSRILLLHAVIVAGVSCLVYCLSIAMFVNPDMDEYTLIIAMPFLCFVLVDLVAIAFVTAPLDKLVDDTEQGAPCSPEIQAEVHNIHHRLIHGLLPVILVSTSFVHFTLMAIEDDGFTYLLDPDSWSLLINRCALFAMVTLIQGSLFDHTMSRLKSAYHFSSLPAVRNSSGLLKRVALMLISLSLFLGSSISLFSTMRFDLLIDQSLPSIVISLEESENLAADIPMFVSLLEEDRRLYSDAIERMDRLMLDLETRAREEELGSEQGEEISEAISVFYDSLPLMSVLEEGMDTQNSVSYVFMLLAVLCGLIVSYVYSRALNLQVSLLRGKMGSMLARGQDVRDEPTAERLVVTTIDETADLVSDFNRILAHNEHINQELLRADKVKDAFLANVSHELKTPLHGIIGLSESLIDGVAGSLSEEARFNLQLIQSNGRRLSGLVNDILDFSKLKEHDLVLKRMPIDLHTLVEVVSAVSRPLLKGSSVELVNEVDPELVPVDADENRLQQVLLNLIGNAIKFTHEGSIKITATLAGENVMVCVCDTGVGVPKGREQQIFLTFEQADGTVSRNYGGSGLGLSISRELVELHGGELWLERSDSMGSQFCLTLPVSTQEKTELSHVKNPISSRRVSAEEFNSEPTFSVESFSTKTSQQLPMDGQAKSFTILIVDDEPVNLTVLQNYLNMAGYNIVSASSGEEALQAVESCRFDMILLDVMMPRMSGFEVCKRIRKTAPINRLPIIMLTAKDQAQDLMEGFSCGANDYISKPFSKNELLSRIKTHLELAKINSVYADFVPTEYLSFLGHDSILDVRLGDSIEREMTIMFVDIRSYTSLTESLTPQESFELINDYLAVMGPCIKRNNGFVNHYLGDGMMALFPGKAEDAIAASTQMLQALEEFNSKRLTDRLPPIQVGVGLHYGRLIFGIIGDVFRKSGNVISDDVNISSRLEGLTKHYGSSTILSHSVLERLPEETMASSVRYLGRVVVKGKIKEVSVYELLNVEDRTTRKLKRETLKDFEDGLRHYFAKEFGSAGDLFRKVLNVNGQDKAAQLYLEQSVNNLMVNPAADWDGAVSVESK